MYRVVFPILFIFLSACAGSGESTGGAKSETRVLEPFSAIDLSGSFEIELIKGDPKVMVSIESGALEDVESKVENGTLYVHLEEDFLFNHHTKLIIYYQEIRSLSSGGAIYITSEQMIEAESLNFDLSGASELRLDIKCKSLSVDASGASKIQFTGQVENAVIDASGAVTIDAAGLHATNVTIDASGTASASIFADASLKVDASGAVSIRYKGDPHVTEDVSGVAVIQKL